MPPSLQRRVLIQCAAIVAVYLGARSLAYPSADSKERAGITASRSQRQLIGRTTTDSKLDQASLGQFSSRMLLSHGLASAAREDATQIRGNDLQQWSSVSLAVLVSIVVALAIVTGRWDEADAKYARLEAKPLLTSLWKQSTVCPPWRNRMGRGGRLTGGSKVSTWPNLLDRKMTQFRDAHSPRSMNACFSKEGGHGSNVHVPACLVASPARGVAFSTGCSVATASSDSGSAAFAADIHSARIDDDGLQEDAAFPSGIDAPSSIDIASADSPPASPHGEGTNVGKASKRRSLSTWWTNEADLSSPERSPRAPKDTSKQRRRRSLSDWYGEMEDDAAGEYPSPPNLDSDPKLP